MQGWHWLAPWGRSRWHSPAVGVWSGSRRRSNNPKNQGEESLRQTQQKWSASPAGDRECGGEDRKDDDNEAVSFLSSSSASHSMNTSIQQRCVLWTEGLLFYLALNSIQGIQNFLKTGVGSTNLEDNTHKPNLTCSTFMTYWCFSDESPWERPQPQRVHQAGLLHLRSLGTWCSSAPGEAEQNTWQSWTF